MCVFLILSLCSVFISKKCFILVVSGVGDGGVFSSPPPCHPVEVVSFTKCVM